MEKIERFTLVVRDCEIRSNQLCITGKPFGEYKAGDALYLRKSNFPVVKLDVKYVSPKGDLLEIYTEAFEVLENMKYAVVTNIESHAVVDTSKPVENPFLLGLSREYREYFKEPDFLNEYCFSLITAKFIVPVISEDLGKKALDGDNKVNVNIGFHIITTQKGRKVLPVFTDWGSLNEWKSFREAENHKTLILTFDQVCDIASRDQDGFIINAFDIGVVMPMKFLESIKKSDGYKNISNVSAKKMTSKSGNVQVGIPQDNEQIKLLKEAIISVGKDTKEIKEGYLFLKKDGDDIAFLIVFDLDLAVTEEERTAIFGKANSAVAPILGGKLRCDFAMKAPHFIKLCNAYVPVYKAE